ncbi:MAG: hypothetical protein LBR17_05675 [Bacteroidales bacterium]|jgi:hypothetical protein|nr:hypothetical protein [Bacteroidales bacterium]
MNKYFIPILASVILFVSACDNFEGEQEIPAYIKIKGFRLVENTNLQYTQSEGFLTSAISDVWISFDGDTTMMAFPLKEGGVIPVLKKGKVKINVQAGILLNGIRGTRVYYPFYTTYEQEITLTEEKITDLDTINIKYRSDWTTVPFDEQFEDSYMNFRTVGDSVTERLVKISNPDSVRSGMYSGAMYMNATDTAYKIICKDSIHYTDISQGSIYLEIDYRSNIPLETGVYGFESGSNKYLYISAVTLNPSKDKWKKIYIQLTKAWDQLNWPSDFWFYLQPSNPNKLNDGWVYIDNVKIVHFPD